MGSEWKARIPMIPLLALSVLKFDQAGTHSPGFPFNVPPQHLHPRLRPSETCPGFTSHIPLPHSYPPQVITNRNVQFIPWHDSPHKLVVDPSLVDSTLTLHTPKTHAKITTNPHHNPRSNTITRFDIPSQTIPFGSPSASHHRYKAEEYV